MLSVGPGLAGGNDYLSAAAEALPREPLGSGKDVIA
jgi:hypothetical protein